MPKQDINLIPSSVVKERNIETNQQRFLVFSVIVLIVSAVLTAVIGTVAATSSTNLSKLQNEVATKQNTVKSLEDAELKGLQLQARLGFIDSLLNRKVVYSKVLDEIELRIKEGIVVTNVQIGENLVLTISGNASSTTALQNYINGLVLPPDNLFSEAKVMEVSIGESSAGVRFKVSVEVDEALVTGI